MIPAIAPAPGAFNLVLITSFIIPQCTYSAV